jgi:drug/metabolite transporter superfamily protein YnfA
METIDWLAESPAGAFLFLALAAFLEAFGDSCFQTAFYRSSGVGRVAALVSGAVVLAAYGSIVNLPRWDFGRLIGVYVVLFFVTAQVLNKVRFGQAPTLPIWVGGSLVVAGGLVMALWQR